MSINIDLLEYPRVELGWNYLNSIVEALGKSNSKIELVYLFTTHELIITDESLLTLLNQLNIPFKESRPGNSLRFLIKN